MAHKQPYLQSNINPRVKLPLNPGDTYVGSSEYDDITLGDEEIGRSVALFTHIEGITHLENMNSPQGIYVNGMPVRSKEPRLLEDGDYIVLGKRLASKELYGEIAGRPEFAYTFLEEWKSQNKETERLSESELANLTHYSL